MPPTASRPAARSATRRAFTLTELLIVIGIIIVLVSIFIPAVGSARITAQRSSTNSFMSSILTSSAQFQAAERRLPGYFSQLEMATGPSLAADNYSSGGTSGQGFTQMENALLDLAGGIDSNQDDIPSPPTGNGDRPDRLYVGPREDDSRVVVRRSLIGADDQGPGYLTIPENFVDNGSWENGQVGDVSHRFMPDLVDAFGQPILMWTKNDLAGSGDLTYDAPSSGDATLAFAAQAADDIQSPASTIRAWFYAASNSGHLHSESSGKKGINQQQLSLLSFEGNNAADARQSMQGLLGHPSFPQYEVPGAVSAREPFPSVPRGDIIVHSAGPDGVYAENGAKSAAATAPYGRVQYFPAGYSLQPSDNDWFDRSGDNAVPVETDRLDDLLLSHGG